MKTGAFLMGVLGSDECQSKCAGNEDQTCGGTSEDSRVLNFIGFRIEPNIRKVAITTSTSENVKYTTYCMFVGGKMLRP